MRKIIGKFGREPAAVLLACGAAVAFAACAPDRPDGSGTDDAEARDEPVPQAAIRADVRDPVVTLGSEAAGELATRLIGRLQEALAAEGPAGAVAFCSAEGLPLTNEVARTTGFDIKRTSSRVRNPANAPDSLERAALAHFESGLAADSAPGPFVQRTPAGDYRYYQPLRIQPLCTRCHGPRDELAAGVAEVLAERYPADEATGYAVGEFRGLIRVTIPASEVEEAPPAGS